MGKRRESLIVHQTKYKGASCALSSCLGLGYIRRCMRPSPSNLKERILQPFSFVWFLVVADPGVKAQPIGCARLRSPPIPPCARIRLVAPAYGRPRYHPAQGSGWLRSLTIANHYRPAKGSFARFPSGASLNATMQFTLLPSELEQNLSFSGADCDVRHSIVSGFLPLIDWERRSMQSCNSRSYPRNSDKISLSRAQNTSLRHFTVLQLFDMDFDGTRIPRRCCARLKNFKRRSTFAVCLSFLDFAVCLWRMLERRGVAEPLVYSSTRHSAIFQKSIFIYVMQTKIACVFSACYNILKMLNNQIYNDCLATIKILRKNFSVNLIFCCTALFCG